ncbi:MAG: site-2 protease family protein [Chlamydiae bacterium]|nr:site-2 protease family protein [Chlamydiota bacterium]
MMKIGGKLPISIHFSFWIVSALIGFLYTREVLGTVVWMGIIFISVLIHELGHALTAALFGLRPRIELVGMGGLTHYDSDKVSLLKRFFIILNGPLFGFFLFLLAMGLLQLPLVASSAVAPVIFTLQYVNLFWTIVNLIPVLPLDGGQLLRVICEAVFGVKGVRYALVVGGIIAIAIAVLSFVYGQIFIGALFFLFAFQSYDGWNKTKMLAPPDQDQKIKEMLLDAEELMQKHQVVDAIDAFEKVRLSAKEGLIFNMATQYKAFLEYEQGRQQAAYKLLKSIEQNLAIDGLSLLHKTAFAEKDYPLVKKLAAECFQNFPSVEIALINAYAHAELQESQASIGWLETAVREGLQNIAEAVSLPYFNLLRKDPLFIRWLASHDQFPS